MPKDTITVVLVDAARGEVMGQSRMPLRSLPESFAAPTTLHLGNDDWTVVRAEPLTAGEFARTGKLTLTLARVEQVPARDIMFSLPTLCDPIPPVEPCPAPGSHPVLTLLEDDWRQIELVSSAHQETIARQFREIERIYREHSRRGSVLGFTKLHLRQEPATPILDALSVPDLCSGLGLGATPMRRLAYEGGEGTLVGGFAIVTGALAFYGQESGGVTHVLGLLRVAREQQGLEGTAAGLAGLMARHDLTLVDWCRMQQVPADEAAVLSYLQRIFRA